MRACWWFALTLCLYEMKYLCSDLSCHLSIPPHGLSIHPLQLAQEHEYPGVTGDTGNTYTDTHSTFRDNLCNKMILIVNKLYMYRYMNK